MNFEWWSQFKTKYDIFKVSLSIYSLLLTFILIISFLLNLYLYDDRQELKKQIPHLAGIGGELFDKKVIENPKKEADFINNYCDGFQEFVLPDKTRVDCLWNGYAIEFDFAPKWAESVGQSLYYAKVTGMKPAVAIIMRSESDERYIKRIQYTDENITIFKIKAY